MKSKFSGLILILFFLLIQKTNAQYELKGAIIDKNTRNPIPFVIITNLENNQQTYCDIEGIFNLVQNNPINTIRLSHPEYYQLQLNVLQLNNIGNITLYLEPNKQFNSLPINGKKIVARSVKNIHKNDYRNSKGVTYTTYNKVKLEAGENPIKNENILGFLKRILTNDFVDRADNNTLFIAESVTKKRYRTEVLNNEIVIGNKTCGIKDPSVLSLNSQYQFYSFYDPIIEVKLIRFVSPISKAGLKRYNYELVDSINTANNIIYKIGFSPKNNKYFFGFKGYFLIDKQTNGLVAIHAQPSFNRHIDISIKQQYYFKEGYWVPEKSIIRGGLLELGDKRKRYLLQSETYFNNVKTDTIIKRNIFTDNLIEIEKDANIQPDTFWINNRAIPLSEQEQNTYRFYDKLGKLTNIDKFLIPLKSLNEGKIPIKKIDFDLRNFIRYNIYERTRINIGLNTNEKFSNNIFLGGYVGYGYSDENWKYGINGYYTPNRFKYFRFGYRYTNDITEAGSTTFQFSKRQFSSELIRIVDVSTFDNLVKHQLYVNSRIFKNLYVYSGLDFYKRHSLYDYQFKDYANRTVFQFTDAVIAFKYHYGELFIKNSSRRFSIGSKYPAFWLQFTKSINALNNSFDYTKIDIKVEDKIYFIGIGTLSLQATAGAVIGDLPYGNLYVGKGAFRNASIVIHNSFETMRFNEFLSDRHFSVFLSHNLGKIKIKKKGDQPSLEIIQNIGYGSLNKPELHHSITFKTMEKGYYESGFFINDILSIRIYSLKAGIGIGAFYRYGYYANPVLKENVVFKIATNFNF